MKYINPLKTLELGSDDGTSPIGVFLHGFGASAANISLVCQEFLDTIPYWIIPQAPVEMQSVTGEEGYAWFPKSEPDMRSALAGNLWNNLIEYNVPDATEAAQTIADVFKTYKLHQRTVVLAGFSQGGMVASEATFLISQENETSPIAALLLFSSSVIALNRWKKSAATCKNIPPVLVTHGERDAVLRPQLGDILFEFWKHHSHTSEFFSYDDEHTITAEVINHAKQFIHKVIQ